MKVGASYYPELLPVTDWEKDLLTGRGLGLSALRCGEFAWTRLAPKPGEWKTDWVHKFLQFCERLDYQVIWCTPTATPPPYLFDRWPDLNAVNADGHRTPVGVRRNYCPSHPGYLELAAATATRLAGEFSSNPVITGWQVDNELAGDGFTCWCETCRAAFHRWLERRYHSLDQLNADWQTDFWAQRYTDWSQIPMPVKPFNHAPAIRLAYRRFRSDCWLAFYAAQADALRAAGAKTITTNFFDFSWDMPFDQWSWSDHLDAVGLSHYVGDEMQSRFTLAALRGVAGNGKKPLWVLEQGPGSLGTRDDLSRLTSHLTRCAEAGAGYAIYWHLRSHSSGVEMEHGAVLRHDGKATAVARAVQKAIADTRGIKPVEPNPDALLFFSFAQQWANENCPPWPTKWDYRTRLEQDWYAGARDVLGEVKVGGIAEAAHPPRLLIVPLAQLLEPGLLDAMDACLKSGGAVITTSEFGRLDNQNNIRRAAPLAALDRWIDPPDLEVMQLKAGELISGQFDGTAMQGSILWSLPPSPVSNGIGDLTLEEMRGPLALCYDVGRGFLMVVLTEPDRGGVASLVRLGVKSIRGDRLPAPSPGTPGESQGEGDFERR